jgi:light-regulated signal transduction histidine kinase (bacteriophytochrome)
MGRTEIHQGAVAVEPLVKEVIAGLETDLRDRHVEWKFGKLPEVQADRAMLRQVFANLIGNAIKYSKPRDPAHIEIGCTNGAADKEVVFFVRDDGVGFDMKYADKLFGVFQRLHRAEDFEGTGIGLANVRRIIFRHGGRTWAEGEVDKGATFYFSLPRASAG